jgi:hypothetical protein
MEDPKVTPREWMRQWLAMLDARQPGWRCRYDREAFELAVEDLFGQGQSSSLGEEGMEVLGEFTIRHDEQLASLSSQELKESPDFRRAMIEFEYIFRSSHGSSRDSMELREMRKGTLKKVVDAVLEPMLDRLVRLARAREMREFRRSRKHPRIARAEPYRDPRSPAPEAEVAGREAAARTVARARQVLSPAAFEAICRFFGDREGRPACEAARSAGVSPATMTRALHSLQDISSREFEGCPEGGRAPFAQALSELLGSGSPWVRSSSRRPSEE